MMTDDARQIALQHAAGLDNHGNIKDLLENAEKIFNWLQGGQNKPISGTTYRGTESKGPG